MYTLPNWPKSIKLDQTKNFGLTNVKVPARFDFIGGWTDTPPYYFENPAAVLNSTITLTPLDKKEICDNAISITISPAKDFSVHENGIIISDHEDHLVIRETLKFLGLTKPKLHIEIENSIPKGSGLGGSSLFVSALLSALLAYFQGAQKTLAKLKLITDSVLMIEQMMESGGGWQDQIGGLVPGLKLIETTPDQSDYLLSYTEAVLEKLNQQSLIINSNIQRKASKILYSIRDKAVQKDPRGMKLLKDIATYAQKGFEHLKQEELEKFANLYRNSWNEVNAVETASSIELVDRLKSICGLDLWGYKIGGAGGGGFILLTFESEKSRNLQAKKILQEIPTCQIYKPYFGRHGLQITQDNILSTVKKVEKI